MTTPGKSALGITRSTSEDEATGLPGVRTWRGVYWLVVAVFALWVGLLTWFTLSYA